MNPDSPKIKIEPIWLRRCFAHGVRLWFRGTSPKKDWESGKTSRTKNREITDFVFDRVDGKVAEYAFQNMLYEYYGIKSKVDWEIYDSISETDDGDLLCVKNKEGKAVSLDFTLDVKKTKIGNKWLLSRKSIWESYDENDIYVLCRLNLPRFNLSKWEKQLSPYTSGFTGEKFRRELEEWSNPDYDVEVEISGYAKKKEFKEEFPRGSKLYDPNKGNKKRIGGPLKTDNLGIPVRNLNRDWDSLSEYISNGIVE